MLEFSQVVERNSNKPPCPARARCVRGQESNVPPKMSSSLRSRGAEHRRRNEYLFVRKNPYRTRTAFLKRALSFRF